MFRQVDRFLCLVECDAGKVSLGGVNGEHNGTLSVASAQTEGGLKVW
jgi:hypothetical protein